MGKRGYGSFQYVWQRHNIALQQILIEGSAIWTFNTITDVNMRRVQVHSCFCGEIMTMPGLPKVPSAENITINKHGDVEGLF